MMSKGQIQEYWTEQDILREEEYEDEIIHLHTSFNADLERPQPGMRYYWQQW